MVYKGRGCYACCPCSMFADVQCALQAVAGRQTGWRHRGAGICNNSPFPRSVSAPLSAGLLANPTYPDTHRYSQILPRYSGTHPDLLAHHLLSKVLAGPALHPRDKGGHRTRPCRVSVVVDRWGCEADISIDRERASRLQAALMIWPSNRAGKLARRACAPSRPQRAAGQTPNTLGAVRHCPSLRRTCTTQPSA